MANYMQRLDEQLLYNIAQYIKNYQAERGGSPTQSAGMSSDWTKKNGDLTVLFSQAAA